MHDAWRITRPFQHCQWMCKTPRDGGLTAPVYGLILQSLRNYRDRGTQAQPLRRQKPRFRALRALSSTGWPGGDGGHRVEGLGPPVFWRQAARFAGRSSRPRTTAIRFPSFVAHRGTETRTVREDCSGFSFLAARGSGQRYASAHFVTPYTSADENKQLLI
jgi:hypothetical protein